MLGHLMRHWMRVLLLVASIVGAFAVATPPAAAQPADLVAELKVPAASFDATVGVWVDFTLTNRSARPVGILIWNTPFEGIRNNIFRVTKDGRPVSYRGPMVKRAKPNASHYMTLAAGESRTTRVDLAAAYAIEGIGDYRVSFDGFLLDVAVEGPGAPPSAERIGAGAFVPLTSPEVTLQVVKGRTIRRTSIPDPAAPTVAGSTFQSCSATRRTLLTSARSNAYTISRAAYVALDQTPVAKRSTARRSKLWFGAYTSTRYALVRGHYAKISTALNTAAYKFDCSCTDSGVYAYVYPDEPYTVYLCGAFWQVPTTGTDSKAGTLVHETSHFTILGGTDDYVYGQTDAKALAKSSPAKAVMNADNHEYFAENSPSVPQP